MESATVHQGRILLVDDESAILRTFRYCLEDEGYSVSTCLLYTSDAADE